MDFSTHTLATRQRRIREQMATDDVDALFITGAHNVRYATGFRGEPRTLLVTPDQIVLFTSFRCIPWAEKQTHEVELSTEANPVEEIMKRLVTGSTIGVESDVSHERFLQLQSELEGFDLKITRTIETVRSTKSDAEVSYLRKAQTFAEEIFAATLTDIVPGVTERALCGRILSRIAENEKLDGPSFGPIVAIGENAWEIHHQPNQRRIRDGDLVIIDLGVVFHGYCSDMTRTLCVGTPNDEMR